MTTEELPLDIDDAAAPPTNPSPKRAQTSRRKEMSSTNTRRPATFKDLLHKPARIKEVVLKVPDDGGTIIEYVVTLRAIGSKAYDVLVGMHPPTGEQKKEGASYNPDTFGPALIAACAVEPRITPNEAKELWESDEWSRGEVMELFVAAVEVCSRGLDVPFTATDSDMTLLSS